MSANGTAAPARIKVRLTNDFHGSSVVVIGIPTTDQSNEYGDQLPADAVRVEITEQQAARAGRKLCGISDCRCGGHGPQFDAIPGEPVVVVAERVSR